MVDADRNLRDTTKALYLRNLRLHVEDTDLGRTDVRDVTPDDLTTWWSDLDAGPGARRNVHQLVSKALNRAVIAGDRQDNPLRRAPEVKRPGKERQVEVEALSYDQLMELADAARASRRGVVSEMSRERDRLEVLVMGVGGLRAGEVGGLRRQDIRRNGESCELRPRQQVVRETGKPAYVSRLKTTAARRTVSIPCWLMDEIEAFVSRFGVAEDGRVFTGPNGEAGAQRRQPRGSGGREARGHGRQRPPAASHGGVAAHRRGREPSRHPGVHRALRRPDDARRVRTLVRPGRPGAGGHHGRPPRGAPQRQVTALKRRMPLVPTRGMSGILAVGDGLRGPELLDRRRPPGSMNRATPLKVTA